MGDIPADSSNRPYPLIFLSGLSMVPPEIEEAAELETGSRSARLRHVQLPHPLPGFTAMLILRSADVLKPFDVVFTLAGWTPPFPGFHIYYASRRQMRPVLAAFLDALRAHRR